MRCSVAIACRGINLQAVLAGTAPLVVGTRGCSPGNVTETFLIA